MMTIKIVSDNPDLGEGSAALGDSPDPVRWTDSVESVGGVFVVRDFVVGDGSFQDEVIDIVGVHLAVDIVAVDSVNDVDVIGSVVDGIEAVGSAVVQGPDDCDDDIEVAGLAVETGVDVVMGSAVDWGTEGFDDSVEVVGSVVDGEWIGSDWYSG